MDIELCAASPEALEFASKFKFNRVELCQQLELGGLTPSIGFQQLSLQFSEFETHVLIRCRAGSFSYSDQEKELMLRDVFESARLGVHGLVVGSLTPSHELDVDFMQEIQVLTKQLPLTFHRAFDEVSDPGLALEQLCSLGFKRMLTSGQQTTVDLGMEQLKAFVKQASGRIQIMCGGGVRAENVRKVIETVRPDALHFSGTTSVLLAENSLFQARVLVADELKIKAILKEIKA